MVLVVATLNTEPRVICPSNRVGYLQSSRGEAGLNRIRLHSLTGNLLLKSNEEGYLLDFGSSRFIELILSYSNSSVAALPWLELCCLFEGLIDCIRVVERFDSQR